MTIEQFKRLEQKAIALGQAFDALQSAIIDEMATSDDQDKLFLINALGALGERNIAMLPYWWHCQPEWTGGDSSDPRNTKLNPPHLYKAMMERARKSDGVTCGKCGGYVPGHATGAGDICTCEPITTAQ